MGKRVGTDLASAPPVVHSPGGSGPNRLLQPITSCHAAARDDRDGPRHRSRTAGDLGARRRPRLRPGDAGRRPHHGTHSHRWRDPRQRGRAPGRRERADPHRVHRSLPGRPGARPAADRRREPDPARGVPGPGLPVLAARSRAAGAGRGPHLLGAGRGSRAPIGHRAGDPRPRSALHDPDPRARRRSRARRRGGGAGPRRRDRRPRHDHTRRRRRRPGDAGAAAPGAGDRADRARGQLDQRGEEAPAAAPSQDRHRVPARRADRSRERRTTGAPRPTAARRPHAVGARREPRHRTGAPRPGADHRARRLAEPERVRSDPRLQPAAAAASRPRSPTSSACRRSPVVPTRCRSRW